MRTNGKSWLCIAGLLASMICVLGASEFVPPAEGPVAFRRDRIPLEVEAMAVTFGRSSNCWPRDWRRRPRPTFGARRRFLRLPLALDPGNTKARNLISGYRNARHVPGVDESRLKAGRRKIWQALAWLETPEAGIDGRALAACLKDVLVISRPHGPQDG